MFYRHMKLKILCFLFVITAVMLIFDYDMNQSVPIVLNTATTEVAQTATTTTEFSISKPSQRLNMGPCPPIYGKVMIFVVGTSHSLKKNYGIAQGSLRCYQKSTNYTLRVIDIDTDERVLAECKHHNIVFFKKHCAAAAYLNETDWMLVLDADTAVVNPNHCIEEWIDPRVDVLFYERFFNWEIASGNYLAKNTQFAYDLLKRWAKGEFYQYPISGYDNGVLQMIILQTVMPKALVEMSTCDYIWSKATDYDTYMAYVMCVKLMLGANRIWPGQIRIYRRAHAWVRDGHLTENYWCDFDFMLHDFKGNTIGPQETPFGHHETPFSRVFNDSECGSGLNGWHYRPNNHISVEKIKIMIRNIDVLHVDRFPQKARVFPWLEYPDIGECWPNCETDDLEAMIKLKLRVNVVP